MRNELLLGISNMCMGAEPLGKALRKVSFLISAVHVELWVVDCTVPAVLLKSGLACSFFFSPPLLPLRLLPCILFLLQVNGRTESGVKILKGTEKSK